MNDIPNDPWRAKVSDYVDDELRSDERAALERHLVECAACRAFLEDARKLRELARRLPARFPDHDLWARIAGEISPRRRPLGWPLRAAAVILAFALGWLSKGLFGAGEGAHPPDSERFLLVLHEPPGLMADATSDEIAGLVEEYGAWARREREAGRLETGEKLADREGFELRALGATPLTEAGGLGGYFVVRARDYDEALELARACPHIKYGGWIEVRRIQET